jgi:hypothetical protein
MRCRSCKHVDIITDKELLISFNIIVIMIISIELSYNKHKDLL